MKIYNEIEKDAFVYYDWLFKDIGYKKPDNLNDLSMFSIIGTMIFGREDSKVFFEECVNEIRKKFTQDESLREYKFYAQVNIRLENKGNRIENYKKVWKLLESWLPLEKVIKGSEIEVDFGETRFFTSIAQFDLDTLPIALSLIMMNDVLIFASKKDNILTEH
jgi:hypothetical protein